MTTGESVLKDEEVDKLVIGWLKKRQLNEALKVLELELEVKGGQAVQAEAAEELWLHNAQGALGEMLLGTAGKGDPTIYASQYTQFETWVDGSLDAYRPQLLRLLYPLFVHTYLELVSLGAPQAAHAMLAESKHRFLSGLSHPGSRKGREAELHELSSLSTPEQLGTSSLAKTVRNKRAPVRLSQYAYDLAMQYLRQYDLMLVLGVMNQWLAIEVVDATAVGVNAIEEGSLLAMMGGSVDSVAVNQTTLELRLLQDSAAHLYDVQKAEKVEREAAEAAQDENATKKQKQDLQKLADNAKIELEKTTARAIASQLPLPSVPKERVDALLADLVACDNAAGEGAGTVSEDGMPQGTPVGPDALPSAAMFTFVNARQTLNCATISSTTECVAAGFADSSVRLYKLKGADGVVTLSGHTGPVYAVDFAPDDQLLLSSSSDGTVRLWSTSDELCAGLVAYRGHMLPVWDVAFAPEYGYYFATASADRTARLWCTERSQALRVMTGHQSDVDVVRWHPNCQYIATGSSDNTVRLWDVRTGSCARLLEGHSAPITAIAFSPDGTTLASADSSGVVTSWDLGSAHIKGTAANHRGPVWSLAYSRGGGTLLASGGSDCSVRLWAEDGVKAAVPQQQQQQQQGAASLTLAATWYTKATPVVATAFTNRNLLLAAGPLSVQDAIKM